MLLPATPSDSPTSAAVTACSTCQIRLRDIQPITTEEEANEKSIPFDEKQEYSEKGGWGERNPIEHYQSECCKRWVCGVCVEKNPRFATYCPFCPIKRPSSEDDGDEETAAKSENTTSPPAYTQTSPSSSSSSTIPSSPPPAYPTPGARSINPTESLIHYLQPHESLAGISLRYSLPLQILRTHNKIYSDNLIAGRSFVLIPRSHYKGASLSPDPVQSEEENVLKRFQVRTKCVEVEVAKVYLDQSAWDLEKAVERWKEDERWEETHDLRGSRRVKRGKAKTGRLSDGMMKGFFR